MRYFAKQEIFQIEWLGNIFKAMGAIPVNRDNPGREALKQCVEVLRAGHPLVLFPEGTRKDGPVVQEIHEGAAYLALKTGVPIVPVGIGGSEAANPRGSKFFRPSKMAMVIGEPICSPQMDNTRVPRENINVLSQELHKKLQASFDDACSRV